MKTNKLFSVLLCLVLCVALALVPVINANAAETDAEPITVQAEWAEGEGNGHTYKWTPTADGTYTIEITTEMTAYQLVITGAEGEVAFIESATGTVTVTAGTEYTLTASGTAGDRYPAGNMSYTITQNTEPVSDTAVITVGDSSTVTWTAPKDGKIKITITEKASDTNVLAIQDANYNQNPIESGYMMDVTAGQTVEFIAWDDNWGATSIKAEIAYETGEEPVDPPVDPEDPNTVDFANGAGTFKWTATMTGKVKVTVTLNVSDTFWSLNVGSVSGDTTTGTAVFEAVEGTEYTIDFMTFGEQTAGKATFTFELVPDEPVKPDAKPLKIGTTQLNQPGEVAYSYEATEAGKLTISLGGAIMGDVSATVYVNGDKANAATVGPNGTKDLTLNANDVVMVEINCTGYSSLTAAFVSEASLPDGTEAKPFPIEEMPYTMDKAAFYTWTATGNGALCITTDGTVKVYVLTENEDGTITKEEVNPARATELRYEVTKGDNLLIELTGEGVQAQASFELNRDGTSNAPWLITEEMPYDLAVDKYDGAEGVYYEWVATINGTLYLTGLPEGAYISFTGPYYENIEGGYKVTVAVGDKVVLNPWNHSTEEGYTLHMEARTPDQEPTDATLDSIDKVDIEIASGAEYSCDWIATENGALTLSLKESTMQFGYTVEVLYKGQSYTLTADAPVELANVAANDRIVIKATTTFATAGGTISLEGSFVPEGGDVPPAGDNMVVVFVLAVASMMALAVVVSKKKAF